MSAHIRSQYRQLRDIGMSPVCAFALIRLYYGRKLS
jgi:hypothetical protein